MRALVSLPEHLEDARICGLPVRDLLADTCRLAGLDPEFGTTRGEGPVLAFDGRFVLLGSEALSEHLERAADGGTLVDWERRPIAVLSLSGGADDTAESLLEAQPSPHREPDAAHEPYAADDNWSLTQLAASFHAKLVEKHARQGVTFLAPDRVLLDATVTLAPGVTVWPGAVLRGTTSVAAGAEIQAGAVLTDTKVGENAVIKPYTIGEGAYVGPGSAVGPMAHLRPGAHLVEDNKVGNFVEVKKATLERGAKASHLTYLGDAHVGEDANIGAGTITCNYDGWGKYRTEIGAGAFIGSNSALVAPITIGAGAIVGAGSTVTSDVPDDGLAVARGEQRTLAGFAPRLHAKNKKKAGK
ncbi:MAG: hypothetical protein EP329_05900 [Deltaproteobacteria bacterium]|nr:MAG: hypothetical protein EP329_05900 [Deltaproteobacteria bacterium]